MKDDNKRTLRFVRLWIAPPVVFVLALYTIRLILYLDYDVGTWTRLDGLILKFSMVIAFIVIAWAWLLRR